MYVCMYGVNIYSTVKILQMATPLPYSFGVFFFIQLNLFIKKQ